MPAKSEKQKKFFGAVMGAKKGQKGSSPEAKKVAKEMPKKDIKKFLKTEDNEEDEQDYVVKTVIRKSKKNPSLFVAVAGGKIVGKGGNKKELINIVSSTIPKLFPNGKIQFIDKTDDEYENFSKSYSDDPYDPGFEEDEQSVVKQMKKGGGKAAFEGPNVKERKHFAPSTQRHKAKKGKGSYDRKKSFDENEEKACWKGYKKEGMKKKGDKIVNNCVKESNSILNFLEAIMTKNHSDAHKYLKDTIDKKLQMRIADEINTPLF